MAINFSFSFQSASDPVSRLKKARRKLTSSFEALIQSEAVNPGEALHAYALTLDFNLRFDKEVENLTPHLEKFCETAVSDILICVYSVKFILCFQLLSHICLSDIAAV